MPQSYQVEECSICLDIIEQNRRELQCTHYYHKACIEKWLEKSNKCPLCMKDIIEIEEVRPVPHIRNNMQYIIEESRINIFINKLCTILGILFIIVIVVIVIKAWTS